MKTKTNEYVTQLNKNIAQSGLYLRVCETKPTVAITWNHARVFIYLFVYLFQQMKTTLKSIGHEIYISVKKSFTIFSCISMHLAIITKAIWRFSRQSNFFFFFFDTLTR